MELLLGLVIGLIAGLLINWVLAPLLDRRDTSTLQQTIDHLQERIDNLELALAGGPIQTVVVREKDDFERIAGLSALHACRLNESGIYTFAQLSSLEPERLARLAQLGDQQEAQAQRWIESARDLAAAQAA